MNEGEHSIGVLTFVFPTQKGKLANSKRRIYQANMDTSLRHTIICLKAHD